MAKVKLQFESLQACSKVDNDDDDDGNDSDHLHLSPPFHSTRETMNVSRESRKNLFWLWSWSCCCHHHQSKWLGTLNFNVQLEAHNLAICCRRRLKLSSHHILHHAFFAVNWKSQISPQPHSTHEKKTINFIFMTLSLVFMALRVG